MGLARLGQPTQKIVAGNLGALASVDFGGPLHCLVICADLHPLENELLSVFMLEEGEGGGSSSSSSSNNNDSNNGSGAAES